MQPNEPKVVLAKKLYCDKTISLDDICATLKMSKSTLYRYVAMNPSEDRAANVTPVDGRHFFRHGHIFPQCRPQSGDLFHLRSRRGASGSVIKW